MMKGQNRQFKPQVYQFNKGRGQASCNYEQGRFQDRFRSNNTYRGRPRYGQVYRGRSRYDSNYRHNYRSNMRGSQRYCGQNYNNNRRGNFRNQTMKETGVGHMIGKIEAIIEGTIEVWVIVDQGHIQEQTQTEIGLDVLNVENMIILQETAQWCKWTER